ncbi:MAG TPA: OmpA family protein [Rhodanobacteraceae bacterium]|nr:OmpA family protein [Rhodanobacteraceae bacterium]
MKSSALPSVILGVLTFVTIAAFTPAARAGDATDCQAPSWSPNPMPGFVIDSCESKAWVSSDYDLPTGNKTLQGERTEVFYTLKDQSKNPAADKARDFQVAAGKKAGAALMSDPGNGWQAVMMQKTPEGEFWYVYDHGSGNSESTSSYTLTTFKIAPAKQVVVAQLPTGSLADMQGKDCKKPPWLVRQFDYFKLADCTKRDFDSITLDLPDGQKTLAGHFLDVNYRLTDEKQNPTARYVRDNYVKALEKIGAKLVSDPDDTFHAVLTQTTPQGELWYIYKHGSGSDSSTTSYSLTSLQIGGPPPKTCKIEVYGVNFDFNQSTIKPESEPVLQQVLALFEADPSYNAEVGGHTDNIGTRAYNLTLSAARAKAVKAWLAAHGVAATRMTTRGYADTVPLVPNTTDENRAKNRRVELKKENCTT